MAAAVARATFGRALMRYYKCTTRVMHVQAILSKFHVYFCGMAGKTDTRVARSVTFTLDTLEDKARYQAHAKKQGRTLAGLIKHLLEQDEKGQLLPIPPPAAK